MVVVVLMVHLHNKYKHRLYTECCHKQCRSVIPCSLIKEKCLELERNLISNPGPDKTSLSKQILNEIDNSSNVFEKEEVIKVSLQSV